MSRDGSSDGICLIRQPSSDDDANDQCVDSLNTQFEQISFDRLFVPRSKSNVNRLSYVDIVQKPSTGPPEKNEKPIVFPSLGSRKVSNASTVSTQAEDEWCTPVEEAQPKEVRKTLTNTSPEDLTSLISDYSSDLSYSTSKRKRRMESRRKEILAKKLDIGLLATIPCPREEPDRSIYRSSIQTDVLELLSFVRNLPEKPCNKYYLSQCLFSACQYSHDYEFSEKQVSAMAWIVKSSPCPEWDTCKHGDNCIYGHVHLLFVGSNK